MNREATTTATAPQVLQQKKWTDEEEAEAKRLMVDLGWSGTRAATELNLMFHEGKAQRTKNSVICRLHRRGLSVGMLAPSAARQRRVSIFLANVDRPKVARVPAAPRPVKLQPAPLTAADAAAAAVKAARAEARKGLVTNAEMDARRREDAIAKGAISLFDAGAKRCKYPVQGTGAGMLVCGDPIVPGLKAPYCAACYAISYTPARSRPTAPPDWNISRIRPASPSRDEVQEVSFGSRAA